MASLGELIVVFQGLLSGILLALINSSSIMIINHLQKEVCSRLVFDVSFASLLLIVYVLGLSSPPLPFLFSCSVTFALEISVFAILLPSYTAFTFPFP